MHGRNEHDKVKLFSDLDIPTIPVQNSVNEALHKKRTDNRLISAILTFLLISTIMVAAVAASAEAPALPSSGSQGAQQQPTPYVTMQVGVEISGLEHAAQQAAEGLTLIGESLHDLSNREEFSPEQNEHLQQALQRVDELGQSLSTTVEALPGTVEKSFVPVVQAGNDLADQIKRILMVTLAVLVLIILAALAAIYYFVLAPATRAIVETTGLLDDLANTLKTTAEIVEKSSAQNLQVLAKMEQLHDQVQSAGMAIAHPEVAE